MQPAFPSPRPRWTNGLRAVAVRLALLAVALIVLEAPNSSTTGIVGVRSAQAQFFWGWGEPRRYQYRERIPRPQRPVGPYYEPRQDYGIPFFSDRPRRPYAQPRRQRREPSRAEARAPTHRAPETEPAKHVVVFGDSLADWLGYGLEEAFAENGEIGITRKHRSWTGLIKNETRDYDWVEGARETLATEKADLVVMMIGLGDRHAIRERAATQAAEPADPNARARRPSLVSHDFGSDRWNELYGKRVDEMIAALKTKRVPVIWVGLPPVRGPKSRADLTALNEIYKERAEKAGIVYVDVWEGFLDESGEFSQFGPDVIGQVRRLRASDGVHFTRPGARKLAHFVEREIKRLLSHDTPVAIPAPVEAEPEGPPAPAGPAPRPVAGPMVPLTGGAPASQTLLGARAQDTATSDPAAEKVLIKGEPLAPREGRADDFIWPRPHTVSDNDVAQPPPAPVVAAAARPAAQQQQEAERPRDAKRSQPNRGLPRINGRTRSAGQPVQ